MTILGPTEAMLQQVLTSLADISEKIGAMARDVALLSDRMADHEAKDDARFEKLSGGVTEITGEHKIDKELQKRVDLMSAGVSARRTQIITGVAAATISGIVVTVITILLSHMTWR